MCDSTPQTPTILNYPGSKKRLLPFLLTTLNKYAEKGKIVLDLFAGTHVVGYALKQNYKLISNDSEIYSYVIGKCLLETKTKINFSKIKEIFLGYYNTNLSALKKLLPIYKDEETILETKDILSLVKFNKTIKNKWQRDYVDTLSAYCKDFYFLFSSYYNNNYYGLFQSMQIDSIRFAIDHFKDTDCYYSLLTALYFAMKESVFAKDGHMAQPLNLEKNKNVLLKKRSKNILDIFIQKILSFENGELVTDSYGENKVLNLPVSDLLHKNIFNECDIIYADPPYTDMQYSRYYHLLETVTRYDYPEITCHNGRYSIGLYRTNRFQSPLSQHGKAKGEIEDIIKMAKKHNKTIMFSYAYPVDLKKQKSNRYTMSIDELKSLFFKYYGKSSTFIEKEPFSHCNNSNSEQKKVFEYLIVGVPDGSNT